MVEELARWKSALSNRINELQETMKLLLEERKKVRINSAHSISYLTQVYDQLNSFESELSMKSSDILSLTDFILVKSQAIANILLKKDDKISIKAADILDLLSCTKGENFAQKVSYPQVTILN